MIDTSKWYVLQVTTGAEIEIQKELIRRGVTAVVPVENRVIRSGGKWCERKYIVFTGYIFVKMSYTWSQYYILSGINGVIRLLGGGYKPEPLSRSEAEWIEQLSELLKEPSVVELYDDGSYEIVSGALQHYKDNIMQLQRHHRRAIIKLKVAGTDTIIKLSFVTPKQTLHKSEG